ncbi:FapA family protein [Psychrosphaera sp. 1_MG-2023]|uniref:DUF342 domain-containing protein n=1 Tax=Psychrosphaera sp. 1_MG-2023 TaxID=3062643 RepID=UPI0026E3C2F6|nr:FapA family protein [Psychrosphaera sp. 1_MG-2023]MDO6718601.1 FapA family protein [Psychrosphaera sp. 1_MG-2023]
MQHIDFIAKNDDLLVSVTLTGGERKVTADDVANALRQSSYGKLPIDDTVVEDFVVQCEFELSQLEENETSLPITVPLAKVANAEIQITVSRDEMSAEAEVINAIGGKSINFEMVKQACVDAGIRFGLKTSLVERLLKMCREAEPGEVVISEVAVGKPAVDGRNARFKPLVTIFSETVRRPKENAKGSVDLRDLGEINTVGKGQAILRKIPFTEGTVGRNVLGEELLPVPGKDQELVVSPSTAISSKEASILVARKTGMVRFNGRVMEVDDVISYQQLDPKQGNVKFKGSVVIKGDVAPDMKIIATGDVIVGGFVECSTIKCGGDLTIMSGASGRQVEDEYNCKLSSGANIHLAFANQCEITAKGLVTISRQVSHCHVNAEAMFVGQGDIANGQISGGRYNLCKHLTAGVIGTESNVHCDISLNRTYDIFLEKEAQISLWLDTIKERFDALENKHDSVMDPAVKAECQKKMIVLGKKLDKYNGQRKALIKKRREYMSSVKVESCQKLYPKVTVYVADKVLLTDSTKGPSRVQMDEYELVINPL